MKATSFRFAAAVLAILSVSACSMTNKPVTYSYSRSNPFYRILPTYLRAADGSVALKNSLVLPPGNLVPPDNSETELLPCNGWGNEYAFLKFGTRLSTADFPDELILHSTKVVTVPLGDNDFTEYDYDYRTFNGVHLVSACGGANYYYCPVGKAGSYLDWARNGAENDYSYGKRGANGLKLSDIADALGSSPPSGSFRISFLPQADADSNIDRPALSVVDTAPGGSGHSAIAAFAFASSNLPLSSISDAQTLDVGAGYASFDDLYLFLDSGDWGASVIVYKIESL